MSSRGAASMLATRASRIKQKLQTALEAAAVEVEDVSYQHAGHAAVRSSGANETHFNVKIVSSKFDGQTLVKRHRMVYDLLSDELNSGLHALSIVAKTPQESGLEGSPKWSIAYYQVLLPSTRGRSLRRMERTLR
ncbi:BolA protein [Dillenia turbinata]|uniref:BolA protein n=1 Tax=Dillenia turbinata TaxID=194707 RepID=A0AAN8V9T7_9MAGN